MAAALIRHQIFRHPDRDILKLNLEETFISFAHDMSHQKLISYGLTFDKALN